MGALKLECNGKENAIAITADNVTLKGKTLDINFSNINLSGKENIKIKSKSMETGVDKYNLKASQLSIATRKSRLKG